MFACLHAHTRFCYSQLVYLVFGMASVAASVVSARRSAGVYSNMSKEKYFVLAQRLLSLNPINERKDCLTILGKIAENLISKASNDPKYLCLKLSNQTIKKRVVSRPGGEEFLKSLGFQRTLPSVGSQGAFMMEKEEIDIPYLKQCKMWMTDAISGATVPPEDIVVLQVRQLNGRSLLAPFLRLKESMVDVHEFVKTYRTDGGGGSFVLCSSYPVVEYATDSPMFRQPLARICGKNCKKFNLIIQKKNVNFQESGTGGSNELTSAFAKQQEIHKKNAARRESIKAEEQEIRRRRQMALATFQEDRDDARDREERRRAVAASAERQAVQDTITPNPS